MNSQERILKPLAIALIAAGLLMNPWVLAALLSDDGSLSAGTNSAIMKLEAVLLIAGVLTFILRKNKAFGNAVLLSGFTGIFLVVCLMLLEGVLAATAGSKYFIWPANIKAEFQPAIGVMPGISGVQIFSTDEDGIRSTSERKPDGRNILAIGGSTTECLYLNDHSTWAALLEKKLNSDSETPVWVGNAGRSGLNSRHHLFAMDRFLPQFPEVTDVILLAGVNDLSVALGTQESFSVEEILASHRFRKVSFSNDVTEKNRLVDYLDIRNYHIHYLLSRSLYILQNKGDIQDAAGSSYVRNRQKRMNAEKHLELPQLTSALQEFERNLEFIAKTCSNRHVNLILLTQPSVWSDSISSELEALLWMGEGTAGKYHAPDNLAYGMNQFNEVIRNVAERHSVMLIDLAVELPKDTTVFYDDCHFNLHGARSVADIIHQELTPTN